MDRMIPAVGDLPSAGQMGLIDEIVELAANRNDLKICSILQ
ncbi:MAG: hypothetical protein CM1200mP39_06050 [Dehalococcoidia bacterium]|nr:MAG: hypothetical protein CM1200mP39_06050 [Dehalococcoidia bacterium]